MTPTQTMHDFFLGRSLKTEPYILASTLIPPVPPQKWVPFHEPCEVLRSQQGRVHAQPKLRIYGAKKASKKTKPLRK